MTIKKNSSEKLCYEVGKEDVAGIYLTGHGNEKTTIYKVVNENDELIVHAGLLVPHEVQKNKG